jgi:hypothetical protein
MSAQAMVARTKLMECGSFPLLCESWADPRIEASNESYSGWQQLSRATMTV